MLIVALITLIYLLYTLIEFVFGFNQIKNLSRQAMMKREALPSISIIFSALNEERKIEEALNSLLKLDYPRLEIIVINDRSHDKTPEILERLQQNNSDRLQVHHIRHLPEGWLGKNHALHVGAQYATGDWLLFTDADVIMKNEALSRSISYTIENNLDHLTIFEHHQRNTFGLKLLLLGNYIFYCIGMKPWRVRYSWSKRSLGHGAFNLIKADAYKKCGGHKAIAMECLDDLKLGELLKSNQFRQDSVDGRDYLEKEWYSSFKEMVDGLKKNGFAYYNYRILPAFRDLFFVLLLFVWPFIGALCYSGTIRWLNVVNVSLCLIISALVAKHFRLKRYYVLFYPFSALMMLFTVWNSIVATYMNKGVIWRGTYYALHTLKNSKPLQEVD